jgi:hypothetical protein
MVRWQVQKPLGLVVCITPGGLRGIGGAS